LLTKLRERASARHGGSLKSSDRFSVAAELWYQQLNEKMADGRRSPSTRDAYRRKLDTHVLPALGEVRLGEITTGLVDSVLRSIKGNVGAPTAKSSRSVISGVLGLAARHGAIGTNPVRDVESVPSTPRHRPRALDEAERREWFAMLAKDPKAVDADLPDLTAFLLATGTRIGEALGLRWSEVDLEHGEVAITGQVIRISGQGLVRGRTKSTAGERVLTLPGWCVDILAARYARGVRLEEPVFCDAVGGFRDPNNVRRDLRRARAPKGSQSRRDLGTTLAVARRSAGKSRSQVAEALAWPKTRVELVEAGRVRLDRGEAGPWPTSTASGAWHGGSSWRSRTRRRRLARPTLWRGSPRTASGRPTRRSWTRQAYRPGRSPTNSATPVRPSPKTFTWGGARRTPLAASALERAHRLAPGRAKSDGFPDETRDR